MSLYQKYRPSSFEQVIGQEAVITNIERAVLNDKVSHAYIFAGPKGTGKTTTARLLASAVGASSIDLLEVDGASTRGIDDVREIRSGSILAPNGTAKAYIIDEAHQLTPAAWDAFLKTLEEPPPRCYFILATTNPDKIPATVRSRCQTFNFRPAGQAELRKVLKRVCKAEGIQLTREQADAIALHANGSYRDALTTLDQLATGGDTSIEALQEILGTVTAEDCYTLLVDCAQGNVGDLLASLARLVEGGADLGRLTTSLLELIRHVLTARWVETAPEPDRELAAMLGTARVFDLAEALAKAQYIAAYGGNVRLALEAALVKGAVGE